MQGFPFLVDFDEDRKLSLNDLKLTIMRYMEINDGQEDDDYLDDEAFEQVMEQLLKSADVNNDRHVSYDELEILMQSSDHFER